MACRFRPRSLIVAARRPPAARADMVGHHLGAVRAAVEDVADGATQIEERAARLPESVRQVREALRLR